MSFLKHMGAAILGVLFVLALLVAVPGYLLHMSSTWGWPEWQHPLGMLGGGVLIAAGTGVILYSTGVFKTFGQGTPSPLAPPRRLVARGLYRRSRNPMYVAYVTVALGEALFFGATVLLIYAAAIFLALHLMIVLHEEPELRQRFGEDYETYRKTVPRWL